MTGTHGDLQGHASRVAWCRRTLHRPGRALGPGPGDDEAVDLGRRRPRGGPWRPPTRVAPVVATSSMTRTGRRQRRAGREGRVAAIDRRRCGPPGRPRAAAGAGARPGAAGGGRRPGRAAPPGRSPAAAAAAAPVGAQVTTRPATSGTSAASAVGQRGDARPLVPVLQPDRPPAGRRRRRRAGPGSVTRPGGTGSDGRAAPMADA